MEIEGSFKNSHEPLLSFDRQGDKRMDTLWRNMVFVLLIHIYNTEKDGTRGLKLQRAWRRKATRESALLKSVPSHLHTFELRPVDCVLSGFRVSETTPFVCLFIF
jgi:hypothetical protein